MDRMDLDELHREQIKRARSINPSISDLRLAVDAAAEMQVCARQSPASSPSSVMYPAVPLSAGCCSVVKALLTVSRGLLSLLSCMLRGKAECCSSLMCRKTKTEVSC